MFSSEHETDPTIDWVQLFSKIQTERGPELVRFTQCGGNRKSRWNSIGVKEIAILPGNSGRLSEIADRIHVFCTWRDHVLGTPPSRCSEVKCSSVIL